MKQRNVEQNRWQKKSVRELHAWAQIICQKAYITAVLLTLQPAPPNYQIFSVQINDVCILTLALCSSPIPLYDEPFFMRDLQNHHRPLPSCCDGKFESSPEDSSKAQLRCLRSLAFLRISLCFLSSTLLFILIFFYFSKFYILHFSK